MNWFQGIVYGIVSGLSEFIPVSSRGHQKILLELFGIESQIPLLDLMVHLATLLAVLTGCRSSIEQLRREKRGGGFPKSHQGNFDGRFVRSATAPLCVGFVFLTYIGRQNFSLLWVSLFFFVNGVILFVPGRMLQGNKTARSMSTFDSFLVGIGGAFSAFPGISRIGSSASVAIARGAGRPNSLNWSLLLSVPALALMILLDFFAIFSSGQTIRAISVLAYFFAMIFAYIGGYFGIRIAKFLAIRTGFSGLSFYCWGVALYSFLLYLI